MCGIAGAVLRGRLRPDFLQAMACALAHRGPDGEGTALFDPFSDSAGDWQAGLSHRRLAVFDPSEAGAQPMTSRSGRVTLVLNGEIYNHPELRRRLPGFRWRTRTDTEVLVELLEAFGPDVLEHVNGMFAFAAWDLVERRLWIARDRVGVKPLFYRATTEGLVFASELAVILRGPRFSRRVDRDSLSSYLDFGFVPAPRTILEGVAKLEPGSLLEWSKGRTRISRWWRLPPASPSATSPSGWRESLYAGLTDAVVIIGFDAVPEAREAIKAGKIYADVIQRPREIGKQTIQAVQTYISGGEVEREILIPCSLFAQKEALESSEPAD